jgi:hypothetical protein
MISVVKSVLSLVVFLSTPCVAQDSLVESFYLGGPRKVVAQVTQEGERIEIAVDMLPISCFDAATNKKLNREKAIRYVHLAFAEYLGVAGRQVSSLKLAEMSVRSENFDKKRFKFIVVLPFTSAPLREEVSSTNAEQKVSAKEKDSLEPVAPKTEQQRKVTPATRPRLLQLADDFIDTSRSLLQMRKSDAPSMPEQMDKLSLTSFFIEIADLEEKAERDFEAICFEVEKSKLLLSTEVQEVLLKIQADKKEFFDNLRQLVASIKDPDNENQN